mgnify:FL=1
MEYTCVDGFCGAGGLSLGLSRSGFDLLLSFDIDETCIETMKDNGKYFKHEIVRAGIENMLDGNLLKRLKMKPGELFLLAGGPPCQGFSVQRIGKDVDERNGLVLQYGRLIEEVRPMYFLMENVAGIQGKRGSAALQRLVRHLEAIGYRVHKKILNAENYGVPQRRNRMFLVGERDDMGSSYRFPEPKCVRRTVRDAISFLPEPPLDGSPHPDHPLHRRDRLSEKNLARINALKEGQGRDCLPQDLLADCHKISSSVIGHRNVYGRMAWDDVAPTITARFDSFTRGQFGHPEQPRSITLQEGALLQTFPIDFSFTGSKVAIARQIGNAVPPRLAEFIGASIIDCYEKGLGDGVVRKDSKRLS